MRLAWGLDEDGIHAIRPQHHIEIGAGARIRELRLRGAQGVSVVVAKGGNDDIGKGVDGDLQHFLAATRRGARQASPFILWL